MDVYVQVYAHAIYRRDLMLMQVSFSVAFYFVYRVRLSHWIQSSPIPTSFVSLLALESCLCLLSARVVVRLHAYSAFLCNKHFIYWAISLDPFPIFKPFFSPAFPWLAKMQILAFHFPASQLSTTLCCQWDKSIFFHIVIWNFHSLIPAYLSDPITPNSQYSQDSATFRV